MTFLQIALPTAILALAFFLKLFIDRRAEVPDLISALCELPVDISFLALSFLAAFVISGAKGAGDGLLMFVLYLVGTVVIVVIWRRSLDLFLEKLYAWAVFASMIGYCLCGYGLVRAIELVSGATK